MSDISHHNGKEIVDYTARGLAREAMQLAKSHEEMDILRFRNVDQQHEDIKVQHNDIKKLISETNVKIDEIAKGYDQKFWSLAVTIIVLLLSGIAALLMKVIFK